jgi:hypothetical protein
MADIVYVKQLLTVAVAATLLAFGGPSPARATAEITIVKPTGNIVFSESNDFASRRFADPWDMSNRHDLSKGQYMEDVGGASWSKGVFSARSTGGDAQVWPLHPGYLRTTYNGRDGFVNRFATSKWNRLSIRMYSSKKTTAEVFWFYNQRWTDFGQLKFTVEPGWNTYLIDPTKAPGLVKGAWTGKPMGLRLDPTNERGVDFKIDWIRLYQQSKRRVTLEWTDSKPGAVTEVYIDRDRDPSNGNLGRLVAKKGTSSNSLSWDPSGYPPGSYYFYLKKQGQPGVYSARVRINQVPLIDIITPDERGGPDWAKTVTGDAWDMKQPTDIISTHEMKDISFTNGVLAATPTGGDPFFHLRVPTPIDADRYHRLTFRFRYDGPFDFAAGTMSRFIWSPDPDNIDLYQTIRDIVTYPTWETYTICLRQAPLDGGSIGWKGWVRTFRFDPLEWNAQHRFYVSNIRLSADAESDKRYTIRWRDNRKNPRPTKVSLYYDTNRRGFDGKRIARGLTQVAGKNSYTWNTSTVPAGRYWVYVVAKDGVSTTRRYSSGPIVIKH